jgi:hypothetical protein
MIEIFLRSFLLFFFVVGAISCQSKQQDSLENTYLRFVGDIKKDSVIDNPKFKLCNSEENVFQYFTTSEGFRYEGEKPNLVSKIKKSYNPVVDVKNNSGYLRIRFVVNCQGETGRFRVIASDFQYNEKELDKAITNQLLKLVENLEGWVPMSKNDKPLDYYMYLIFKINNGQIIEILP